jgi:hypothetical protein
MPTISIDLLRFPLQCMSSFTIHSNHSLHKNVDTDIHMISFANNKGFGLVVLTKVGWREVQC